MAKKINVAENVTTTVAPVMSPEKVNVVVGDVKAVKTAVEVAETATATDNTATAPAYSFSKFGRALLAMHEAGNRHMLDKKTLAECLSVDDDEAACELQCWKNNVRALYNHMVEYCECKNSPISNQPAMYAAEDAMIKTWRALLDCSEEDWTRTRVLRIEKVDIMDLVSFTQKFTVSGGKYAWSTFTEGAFRKKVEICIGIRLAQAAVVTRAEDDFICAQRKMVSKINRYGRKIADLSKLIDEKRTIRALIDEGKKEALQAIDRDVATMEQSVENNKKAKAKAEADLAAFRAKEENAEWAEKNPIKR